MGASRADRTITKESASNHEAYALHLGLGLCQFGGYGKGLLPSLIVLSLLAGCSSAPKPETPAVAKQCTRELTGSNILRRGPCIDQTNPTTDDMLRQQEILRDQRDKLPPSGRGG